MDLGDFTRVVVAVDPAVTANEDSDDSGVIVVAKGPHQPETCQIDRCPGHGYVLDDRTCHLIPAELAKHVVLAYDEWQADRIVAEVNNGGDYIGALIHAVRAGVPYATVHATRGKQTRAEPVSALYEQGRVHHVGVFSELEQEQETWTPDAKWSPNRMDALVWGLTYLGLVHPPGALLTPKGEIPRNTVAQRERAQNGSRSPSELPPHLRRLAQRSGVR